MATIANLNLKADGSFEGTLATLMVTAPIAIIPNGRKAKDTEPRKTADRAGFGSEVRLAMVGEAHARAAGGAGISDEASQMSAADRAVANAADNLGERQSVFPPPLYTRRRGAERSELPATPR